MAITTRPMISVTVPMLLKNAVTLTLRMLSTIGASANTMAIQSKVEFVPSHPMSEQTMGATPNATAATVASNAQTNIQATNQPYVPPMNRLAHW